MQAYSVTDLVMGAVFAAITLAGFLPVWFFVDALLHPPED
jgi:hypothetical protein